MKALVKYALGPGNMEIREVPPPTPAPGQVLVEIKLAGICGSDLHIYHSDIAIPLNPPVVTGHEFCGYIAGLGQGVTGLEVGQRIVSETAFSFCGKCAFCKEGYYNLCNQRRTLGYWYNGVFTSYAVVPFERVRVVPDGISDASAAMAEPLACVVHAVYDLTRIVPGDVVLVSGPGSIGLMATQLAKLHGAVVVVCGTNQDAHRLQMAKRLGADYIVNVQTEDLSEVLLGLTNGYGPDVVLECSGNPAGMDAALQLIKKRGYFTQIGLPGRRVDFDIEKVCYKELHFTGSLGSRSANWDKALQLLASGALQLDALADTVLPITQWEKGFELFENKQAFKVFLTPVKE